MKKLFTLAIALLPLFCYSQDTINIPKHAAKSIIKDLIQCESDQKELDLTKQQVAFLEKKVSAKDSIITYFEAKSVIFQEQISTEKERTQIHKDAFNSLQKEHKKLKMKLFFNQLGSGVLIGITAYLWIFR